MYIQLLLLDVFTVQPGDEWKLQEKETELKSVSQSKEIPAFVQNLIRNVHNSLPQSTRQVLTNIIMRPQDVFSQSEDDLGTTDIVTHCIDTGEARTIRERLRRYASAHVEAISQQVDDCLKQGLIHPASSPWCSNLVLVKKKDGSYRCSVDYRRLNSVTRRDAYPLPQIEVSLDTLASAKWFSPFDLKSSYHQVLVNPEDSDKKQPLFVLEECVNFGRCRLDYVISELLSNV